MPDDCVASISPRDSRRALTCDGSYGRLRGRVTMPSPGPPDWRDWRRTPWASGLTSLLLLARMSLCAARACQMDEKTVRETAREAIRSTRLPSRRPDRTWGGPGVGAPCAVCELPVRKDEMEFEIQFARDGADPGTRQVSRPYSLLRGVGVPSGTRCQASPSWTTRRLVVVS